MSNKKTESIHFEKSLQELEQLVKKMETGQQPLEDSLKHFEQGIHLIRQCQQALTEAEQKVAILTQNSTLEPFNHEE